jgi:hypothetical protein
MIWNPKVHARSQDTKFIQVRVARVATLRSVWSSISCPTLGVIPGGTEDVRLGTRPFFIKSRGQVPSRLQGRSPSRITRNES